MAKGIIVCGLNGSGKSTLGKALADKLKYRFIDNENLFFNREKETDPFENPLPKSEAIKRLEKEIDEHGDFIFASVKGDYGEKAVSLYEYVVYIKVPKNIRMERIRNRSFRKFGNRMLLGGDLYEKEESFFKMSEEREESYVENWLNTLNCPIITLDGEKTAKENLELILKEMNTEKDG